nr:hypothetical protein [Pseudomonas kuykendallii]
MIFLDEVSCDCCGASMGKLYRQPAPQADLLPDLRLPPHFTVCPDCWENTTPVIAALPHGACA